MDQLKIHLCLILFTATETETVLTPRLSALTA